MDAFTEACNVLASPPVSFSVALALFFAGARSRLPWTHLGGALVGLGTVVLLAVALRHEGFRRLLLDPSRLPAAVLLLASAAVLWGSLRRRGSASTDGDAVAGGPRKRFQTAMAILLTGLAVVLCAALLGPPLAGPADPAAPTDPGKVPWCLVALQEMQLYLPPWAAWGLLPLLFLGGLLALPAFGTAGGEERDARRGQRERLTAFLFGWWMLWLWPLWVGTFLRGPGWRAYGPFEAWDAGRPPAPAPLPLSELVWVRWLGAAVPESAAARELPGLLLVVFFFVVLPWILPRLKATRGFFGRYKKALGGWRYRLALALLLALTLLPLKMLGHWLFGVGAWVHLPELPLIF